MTTFRKDPDATLDYSLDWTVWLPQGDTIATATWTVPDGLTQPAEHPASIAGAITTVWLAGGTLGDTYEVACRVTTTQGRTDDRTINIEITAR